MQIEIPETIVTEHDIAAENLLEALRKLVTGTLNNTNGTPSTMDVFDLMEQHKDALLAEEKENPAAFKQAVTFAITTKVLVGDRIKKFLDLVEAWGLPLHSNYILVSMNLLDQTVFDHLAEKKISVLDQPPALWNVFQQNNEKQILFILEQIVASAEYCAAHSSDINNVLRSTTFTEASSKVALEILKLVSDKVKNVNIKDPLLVAAVKADKVLCEKYFPSPPAKKAETPSPAPAPEKTETPAPAPVVVPGSTIVPEKTEDIAPEKTETTVVAVTPETIHERLARIEAAIAQVAKTLATDPKTPAK